MANYSFTIKVPARLDAILAWPVLLYRWLRYGYAYRRIKLTKGQYAKVDAEDYEEQSRYKWYAVKGTRTYYACRTEIRNGKRVVKHMHREIINAPDEMIVDHKNRDGRDNRKANLRLATPLQNKWNSLRGMRRSKSKFKGVTWDKDSKKWRVLIHVNSKRIDLGRYENKIEAAKVYDAAAKKYHGEFAVLNFPRDS